MKKPVVFLVCTGLGRINRGYESFTKDCFEALKNTEDFNLYLIKGGGDTNKKEKVVFNVYRNGRPAKLIGKILGLHTYGIEQISFCIGIMPLIIKKKPALIYYSDFGLGSYLWHLRRYLKFKYRLLFCNGAPNGPPYKTEDHIQQLLPVYYSIGIKADGSEAKHTLLPYGFNINVKENTELVNNKEAVRKQFGFSTNQKLILAAGVINKRHKRIDYIINEISVLPDNYFLILLGQYDDETDELVNLAKEKLPGRHLIANLNQDALNSYYAAADYFVLASLQEGFGRVIIEAMSYGLPCIVHDYVVTKQVLKGNGFYVDMRFKGQLAECLKNLTVAADYRLKAITTAFNLYSWNNLKDGYRQMIINQLKNQ